MRYNSLSPQHGGSTLPAKGFLTVMQTAYKKTVSHIRETVLTVLLCLWACCSGAAVDPALPDLVIMVDKSRQQFIVYEQRPALRERYRCICTTGSIQGDKLHEGDKKTPEGVYFVEGRVAEALDFREYGGTAYCLSYPNPVDRLRGKQGHGIWIHSKGYEIRPMDTRGCVAIGLRDMAAIAPLLTPGMPVLLAAQAPDNAWATRDSITASYLRLRMQQWFRACAEGSATFFRFFHADAYTQCMPESFAQFRERMERRFRDAPHRSVYHRAIHALEGPGYWVTWTEACYDEGKTPEEGICRLYWQQDQDGFHIVGMEWLPQALDILRDAQQGLLRPVEKDVQKHTPAQGDGLPQSIQKAWKLEDSPASRTQTSAGQPSAEDPRSPVLPEHSRAPSQLIPAPPAASQRETILDTSPESAAHSPEALLSEVVMFIDIWRQAWESGNVDSYIACYAPAARQQQRQGAASIRRHKEALWKSAAPARIMLYQASMQLTPQGVQVSMMQDYTDTRGHQDRGRKTLLLQLVEGKLHIVDEQWIAWEQ